MSGIFGIFSKQQPVKQTDFSVKKCINWNRPYGLQSSEIFEKEHLLLGCHYEHVTRNPVPQNLVFHNTSSHFITDCILYNREELLTCHTNKETSDEELLNELLALKGLDSLSYVNGDFSGAIFCDETNTLTLFRDHMGIRPLYYYADKDYVVFSTELRGILALDFVDTTLNPSWVFKTCSNANNISLLETEYKHIFCVPPASWISFCFTDNSITKKTTAYWTLRRHKIKRKNSLEYQKELRALIEDSIKRRLDVIDGPVGAELSGGLDSGVIDILINRFKRKGFYFSWSYSPEEVPLAPNDERLTIQDICKQENISCHYRDSNFLVKYKSDTDTLYQKIGLDTNTIDGNLFRYGYPAYVNTFPLCDSADYIRKSGAKVIFTGHGGDEGVSHRSNPYELFYFKEYLPFLKQVWSISYGRLRKLPHFFRNVYHFTCYAKKTYAYQPDVDSIVPPFFRKEYIEQCKHIPVEPFTFAYDPLTFIHSGGSRGRLDNVALHGAYNQVRFMVPYLDYRVIDFAVSIPRHLYLNKHTKRYIFREAFKDILPESLYKLNMKEDTSYHNIEKKDTWYQDIKKTEQVLLQYLTPELLSDYIDFDQLRVFLETEQPTEALQEQEMNKMQSLKQLAMAVNAVTVARKINPEI